jgi:hypothetical protein
MRRLLVLTLLLAAACESPVESSDRSVLLSAAWEAPATEFDQLDTVPGTPAVKVTDRAGRPIAGVTVSFTPIIPPNFDYPRLAVSGPDGVATMAEPWFLGTRAGEQQLVAFVSTGQSNDPVIFSVTVRAGPPTAVAVSAGADTLTAIGDTITVSIVFRDAAGNIVPVPPSTTLVSRDSSVVRPVAGTSAVVIGAGSSRLVVDAGVLRDSLTIWAGYGAPEIDVQSFEAVGGSHIAIGSDRVAYVGGAGPVRRYDVATLALLPDVPATTSVTHVAPRVAAGEVWIAESSLPLRRVDAATGTLLESLDVTPSRLAVSHDESFIVVAQSDGSPALVRPGSPSSVEVLSAPEVNWRSIAIGPGDSLVYMVSTDGTLRRWQIGSGSSFGRAGLGSLSGVGVDVPRNRVYLSSFDGRIRALDAAGFGTVRDRSLPAQANDIGVSLDGRYLFVAGNSQLWVLDAVTLVPHLTVPISGIQRFAVDPVNGDVWVVRATTVDMVRVRLTSP